jgi:hypothetical protein
MLSSVNVCGPAIEVVPDGVDEDEVVEVVEVEEPVVGVVVGADELTE